MNRAFPVALATVLASWLSAGAQEAREEYFDTNWPGAPHGAFTNVVNPVSGWSVTNARITGGFGFESSPYAAVLNDRDNGESLILTPLLSNGVGAVSFRAKNTAGTFATLVFETSPDESQWLTNALFSVSSTTMATYSTNLVVYSNRFARFRKTADSPAGGGTTIRTLVDNVTIALPPSAVQIAAPYADPPQPLDGEAVAIKAALTPLGLVSNLQVTAYWRPSAGAWQGIGMATNAAGLYVTTNAIPGASAGATIQYYVQAVFQGYNAYSPTNNPTQGSNSPLSYLVRVRPYNSGYNRVAVTGAVEATLYLVGDSRWQGVGSTTSALVNAPFGFQGVTTNVPAATNAWGDTAQSDFILKVEGTADSNAPAITIPGTNTGQFVFTFNDTNLDYTVNLCHFQDFDTWPLDGTASNNGWWLQGGVVTNDVDRTHRSRSGQLGTNGGAFLQSVELPEGIGDISFWYRNYQTNGTPVTHCRIEKSMTGATNASAWVLVTAISNISVSAYVPYTITVEDRNYRYVRIVNASTGAVLCLDEVLVTDPYYAGARLTALAHTPVSPTATNPVSVGVSVRPLADAVLQTVDLLYRSGTNAYSTIPMTGTGGLGYVTVTNVPAGIGPTNGAGRVDYYVRCTFTGFQSTVTSPVYLPLGGVSAPTNYLIQTSSVLITNVATIPTPAVAASTLQFEAQVLPQAAASNVTARAWYRFGGVGAYQSLAMAAGTSNRYVSSSVLAAATPGLALDFYVTAQFYGAIANPPVTTTSATSTVYLRAPPFASAYTNVSVSGSGSGSLALVTNGQWRGIATLTGPTASVRFIGLTGSGSNVWGDADQTVFAAPADGTAGLNEPAISLTNVTAGTYVFHFDENTLAYSILRADAVTFDDWTTPAYTNFGAYTNGGWALLDGRVTATNQAADVERQFRGRSGVLASNITPASLVSPYLTNGVGEITFWYRNWETNASKQGSFSVQIAETPTSTWRTVATVTNILSYDYLPFTVALSDRYSHAVRIVSTNANRARLLLDEVVVAEPAAGLLFSNLVHSPSAPTILDLVNVEVDILPQVRASNLTATVWFRMGTNTSYLFDSRPMTNAGNHFITSEPLPRGDVGPVYYYVSCAYSGLLASRTSPTVYPPNAPAAAAVYTNTVDVGSRTEPFASTSGWTNQTAWVDSTNSVTGWSLGNGRITGAYGVNSSPYAAVLPDADGGNESWIRSPFFSNGVGTVYFYAKLTAGSQATIVIELSYDGTTWFTNGVVLVTGSTMKQYSSPVATLSNVYVRLHKTEDDPTGPGTTIRTPIDDIEVTFPAADVAISEVTIDPGYPATSDYVNVSCTVSSVSPLFAAANITPKVYYRLSGGAWYPTPIPMTRTSGDRFRTVGGIPPVFKRENVVEYYVRADFNGYKFNTAENRSPRYYPAAGASGPTNFGPGIVVRAFTSDFRSMSAVLNQYAGSARLLDNDLWQSVVYLEKATNRLAISFNGSAMYTGSGYTNETLSWGDPDAWKPELPLADVGGMAPTSIVVNGQFEGQYVVRFNESTLEYYVLPCAFQDFDNWTPTTFYTNSFSDAQPPLTNNFDNWPLNVTLNRGVENFSTEPQVWNQMLRYTNVLAFGGPFGYGIDEARMTNSNVGAQGWSVVTTNTAFQGHVAQANGGLNPLRGTGTLTFKYRPESWNATNQPVGIGVYLAPTNALGAFRDNPAIWSDSGMTDPSYWRSQTLNIRTSATMAVVIAHDGGHEGLMVDDINLTEWYGDSTNIGNWVSGEGFVWATPSANCLWLDPTRAEDGKEMYIRTPFLTNNISAIDFLYCGTNASPLTSFSLQMSPDGSAWQTLNAVTGVTASYQSYSYYLETNNVYLRVLCTASGARPLILDNMRVRWSATSSKWQLGNTQVDGAPTGTRQFYLQCAYLNNNTNIGRPYVMTPFLTNGVGEISFWYRNYSAASASRLVFQTSVTGDKTNDADWVTVGFLAGINNTDDYRYFRTSIVDRTSRYLRIYNDWTVGGDKVCLDDVLVTAPMTADVGMTNLSLIPPVPLYSDDVHVVVDLHNPFLVPSNLQVYAWYSLATNYGGWTAYSALPMSCVSSNPAQRWYRYQTTTPIPAQPIGTFVRYFAKLDFEGYLAQYASPKTNQTFAPYPTWYDPMNAVYGTSKTYYVVFSCPPGAVWINEFDVDNWTDPRRYVELCGPAGTDIRNWTLEVFDNSSPPHTTAVYRVSTNGILDNDSNGYGFWVVGNSSTTPRDLLLTNTLPTVGGFRLRRSMGAIEYALCYGQDVSHPLVPYGFTNLYVFDDNWFDCPVALVGSGSTYSAFAWSDGLDDGTQSPSAPNSGQTLVAVTTGTVVTLTVADIRSISLSANHVYLVCSGTNQWIPGPWYSTNLANTGLWTAVSTFSSTYPTLSNGTYTLWFSRLTNSPIYFYRVVTTNAP